MHLHLVAKLVPVIDDEPRVNYIAYVLDRSCKTLEREADLLRTYIEFWCETFYGTPFERFMASQRNNGKPFAADPGHNTITFWKRGDLDWAYRRLTWDNPLEYRPYDESRPLSLALLLDHLETIGGRPSEKWVKWKEKRPELFRVSTGTISRGGG
jgi:hypothetical protein